MYRLRLGFAFALVAIFASVIAVAKPLPIRDFARWTEFQEVSISPTGKFLAIVSSPKKQPQKYTLAIFRTLAILKNHPRVLNDFPLREYKMFGPVFWTGNSRIAVETVTYVGGFDHPYLTGALWSVSADGSHPFRLMPWSNASTGAHVIESGLPAFESVLSMLPDKNNYILVQAYTGGHPAAYLINTYGGATVHGKSNYYFKRAQSPTNGSMAADNAGNIRLAFGVNTLTGELETFYRPPNSFEWQNYNGVIPVYVDTHGLAEPEPAGFTKSNKKIHLIQYTDNKNQTRGLFLFDPKTKKEKLIYANQTADAGGSYFSDYGSLIYSYRGDSLVGLRVMPGEVETLVLDAQSQKIRDLSLLSHSFPNQQVQITSATRNGSVSVVRVWSDINPGTYYLFTHKPKPSLTLLFNADPWINPDVMSPMRPIKFTARDGVTIHGYLTVPKNSNGKNLPMLVIVHGGPYGIRDHWGYNSEVQLFADRGYAVLQVNYRGSGGYGNKLLTLGIQHWGDTMQDDVADGVKWAINHGIANPGRICIYGGSYGGYSALMSAERFPNLYRCAIGYSGVYDLLVLKTRKGDIARSAYGRRYLNEVLGSSDAKLKKFSPVYQVTSLKAPVLLMHGGEDVRAPVKGYNEMVDAIKKHGTPLETLYFPREGHGFYKVAHRVKAYKTMVTFLNKYIGPGSTN